MIRREKDVFLLETGHTTYAFRVMETGHLEHLYYGRKIRIPEGRYADLLIEKRAFPAGNSCVYPSQNAEAAPSATNCANNLTLEDVRLEMSSHGKGDIREPFIEVIHDDGSYTSDFLFAEAEILQNKPEFVTMPVSYDEKKEVQTLCVRLKDAQYDLTVELYYSVFEDCDVITRSAKLINTGDSRIRLQRLMSMQLDLDTADYTFTTFNGSWAREMKRNDIRLSVGKHVNASFAGVSSNRANPFVMLGKKGVTEDSGECYGFNLVYSGNHYEAAEVNAFGKTRLVAGINPQSFCFILEQGDVFEAPEAVMTYSHQGYNGMSGQMHRFVREHIVRGEWKNRIRPVLLNSWEASYFHINERKLLNLAKAGKEAGIELFVMDDGWFGARNDDTSSLGDWDVNSVKLPNGLSGLCEKIRALGLQFGIWVEPEMVNVKSKLYEQHPDWVLQIPGKAHSEGRNQRILDLTRKEVQDFLIAKMSEVFSSANISYVKWDMNRIFTDYFSESLTPERQGEVAHRYVTGLYRVMKTLTERFPQILFEGCASGGNRFDLGILSYFPQIWASDDTDALCRAEIQNGYSYGYPMSVVGAHVSACPNHQTLRNTPLETRFNVACFGIFGYECNFCDMGSEEMAAIKAQITLYKEWREVLQRGTFYRGRSFHITDPAAAGSVLMEEDGNCMEWTCVSENRERAVGLLMHKLVVPNTSFHIYQPKGLDEEKRYHFYNRKMKYNIKEFGDLVNMISPVHIRQGSLLQSAVAKIIKMDGETEDMYGYGDAMMYAGVRVKQAFAGTGYNDQVRLFQDFGSRLYFMEEEKEV